MVTIKITPTAPQDAGIADSYTSPIAARSHGTPKRLSQIVPDQPSKPGRKSARPQRGKSVVESVAIDSLRRTLRPRLNRCWRSFVQLMAKLSECSKSANRSRLNSAKHISLLVNMSLESSKIYLFLIESKILLRRVILEKIFTRI